MGVNIRFVIVALFFFQFLCSLSVNAQDGVREERRTTPFILDSLEIHVADVFDSTDAPIPIVGPVVDLIHAITKPRTVRDEVYREIGDTVTENDLDQIETNLQALGIFSKIELTVIPRSGEEGNKTPRATLRIRTKDSWSLQLSGNYSSSSDALSYNIGLQEVNVLGRAKRLGVFADYTNFRGRGWQFGSSYLNPNVFGTFVQTGGSVAVADSELIASVFLGLPFYSDRTINAFSTGVNYSRGMELYYLGPPGQLQTFLERVRRTGIGGWYSRGNGGVGDAFRSSVSVVYNRTLRDSFEIFRRSFENSISVFGGVSSIRRHFTRVTNADMEGTTLVPIGGSGSVSIGKISPHHGGLDNVIYVGGDAKLAVRRGDLYGFASIEGGTGLARKQSVFTTERVVALAAWVLNPGAFVARFEQSNVWNWPRYLSVGLNNATGLRGYRQEQLRGDNRMLLNLEYRLFPIVKFWIFKFGSVAFYDVGGVWDQAQKLKDTRFHSSAGLGLRIGSAGGTFDTGLLRIDLAYNFDERSFSRVIISSSESFDFFGTLDFRPPAPYVY